MLENLVATKPLGDSQSPHLCSKKGFTLSYLLRKGESLEQGSFLT